MPDIENNQPVTQSRWRSPVVWTSIFAILAFVLGNWGLYDVIGITEAGMAQLFNLVLAAMISIGILNNPTDKTGW